ncbi:MAG: transcription elongation factor [Flavobacteriales bacterium]
MNKAGGGQFLKKSLQEKIDELREEIDSAKASRNSESKSSAGDKYETGREMIQVEINKQELQLSKTKQLLYELSSINSSEKHSVVSFGSLIKTDSDYYFISIPYGKIEINGRICYAVSMASPLAKNLIGRMPFDEFTFNGEIVKIVHVE